MNATTQGADGGIWSVGTCGGRPRGTSRSNGRLDVHARPLATACQRMGGRPALVADSSDGRPPGGITRQFQLGERAVAKIADVALVAVRQDGE